MLVMNEFDNQRTINLGQEIGSQVTLTSTNASCSDYPGPLLLTPNLSKSILFCRLSNFGIE